MRLAPSIYPSKVRTKRPEQRPRTGQKGANMPSTPEATLISGYAKTTSSNLVGMSVASVRSQYRQQASIGAADRATINGKVAKEDATLAAGDVLQFDQPTGTKGL